MGAAPGGGARWVLDASPRGGVPRPALVPRKAPAAPCLAPSPPCPRPSSPSPPHPCHLSTAEERLYWEQWVLEVAVAEPPPAEFEEQQSSLRAQRRQRLQAAIEEGLTCIVRAGGCCAAEQVAPLAPLALVPLAGAWPPRAGARPPARSWLRRGGRRRQPACLADRVGRRLAGVWPPFDRHLAAV